MQGYEPWLSAFWELGTDRSFGMSAGPIPSSAIRAHTQGWDPDEAEKFRLAMRALDALYLPHINGSKDADLTEDVDPDRSEPETFSRDMFRQQFSGRFSK